LYTERRWERILLQYALWIGTLLAFAAPPALGQPPPGFVLSNGVDPSTTVLDDWNRFVWPKLMEVIVPRHLPAEIKIYDLPSAGEADCDTDSIGLPFSALSPRTGRVPGGGLVYLFTHEMAHILSNCMRFVHDDPRSGFSFGDAGLAEGYADAAALLVADRLGSGSNLNYWLSPLLNSVNANYQGGGNSWTDSLARQFGGYSYSTMAAPLQLIAKSLFGGTLVPIDAAVRNEPALTRDQYFDRFDALGNAIDGVKPSTLFRRSPGTFRHGPWQEYFALEPLGSVVASSVHQLSVVATLFKRQSYLVYPQYVLLPAALRWTLLNSSEQTIATGSLSVDSDHVVTTISLPTVPAAGFYKLVACVITGQACAPDLTETSFLAFVDDPTLYQANRIIVLANGAHFTDWSDIRVIDDGGAKSIERTGGMLVLVSPTRDVILENAAGRRVFSPAGGAGRVVYMKDRDQPFLNEAPPLSPGSAATVRGWGLSQTDPQELTTANSQPCGAEVFLSPSGQAEPIRAVLRSCAQGSLTFLVPANLPLGGVSVSAALNGVPSNSLVTTVTARAPTITSVLNAAGSLAGRISPGSFVAIKGDMLGANQPIVASTLTVGLGGIHLFFDWVEGYTVKSQEAYMMYASDAQIDAIVPPSLQPGSGALVRIHSGSGSAEAAVLTVSADPAIFTMNQSGTGPAIVVNQDATLNSEMNPAPRGSIVTFFITGMGITSPLLGDGQQPHPANYPATVLGLTVLVNDKPVPDSAVLFAGLIYAGVLQINVRLPDILPAGPDSLSVRIACVETGTCETPSHVSVFVL
jgi:uncharacterized protein (TIGR03437 family)